VKIHRRIVVALVAAGSLALTATMQIPASASAPASAKSLTKDLLPSSYAKAVGFAKVGLKVSTTNSTGNKSCPHGAQVVFENGSGNLALVSEAVACFTTSDAAALLSSVLSSTSATSAKPPKQLGRSAIERSTPSSTYAIYWQRGTIVDAASYVPDVAAARSSTSTSVVMAPITPAQQKILSDAALEQNRRLG
jgi:hypothetical protein